MNRRVPIILALLAYGAAATAAGFKEGYTVAYGDLNGDTNIDLFVKSPRKIVPIALDDLSVPIAVPGDVPDFVLLNTGSRTFNVVPALTSAQLATARQWPVAKNLDLYYRDIDLNGAVDMEIEGLTPLVPQAFNQIIFASPTRGQLPPKAAAKNTKFQRYHEQVFGWMRDPNYFEINAPWKIKSVEPPQRWWYGSIADPTNVVLMNRWVNDCRASYPGYTCAISMAQPPPPCNRTVTATDDQGNPIGTTNDNICSKPVHVIIYLPGGIVLEKDYSKYDPDARETVDIVIRLSASCPYFNDTDQDRLRRIEEQIYQYTVMAGAAYANMANSENHAPFPGDELFNPFDKTFHHYDVHTRICSMDRPNCNLQVVRDIAHRNFSAPHYQLRPEFTNIPGPHTMAYITLPYLYKFPSSYTWEAGWVTQRMVASGRWSSAIQNVTESGHISYPGTISRFVEQRGDELAVFTHGIGINRTRCALTEASRPWELLIAAGNDAEGPKQFNQLSVQMRRWWVVNYDPVSPDYVPYSVQPTAIPGQNNAKASTLTF